MTTINDGASPMIRFGGRGWSLPVGARDWAHRVQKIVDDDGSDVDLNTGEAWNLDDLEGCCYLRDALHSVLGAVSGSDASLTIAATDALFRSITRELGEDEMDVIHPRIEETAGWWWRRVPVSGPLAAEAAARIQFRRLLGQRLPEEWRKDISAQAQGDYRYGDLLKQADAQLALIPVERWLLDIARLPCDDAGRRSAVLQFLLVLLRRAGGVQFQLPTLLRLFAIVSIEWGASDGHAVAEIVGPVLDDASFETTARLVSDSRYGRARQPLVQFLGRSADPRACALLLACLADDDLVVCALAALARLRDPESRTAIESLVSSRRWPVRLAATRALTRLDNRPPSAGTAAAVEAER